MRSFVIMPAYNAEKTVSRVFERIPKNVLREISKIIVVNDGSSDKTRLELRRLAKEYKGKVVIITHKRNKGYGAAQKTGFREALRRNAGLVVILHSDGQYPPEMINSFIDPIKKGEADIAAGSRIKYGNVLKQGMPLHKYIGNRILTRLLNCRFNQSLNSYHSGYKSYSREALKKIDFNKLSNYYNFDTEMLIEAAKNKLAIKEIPIPTFYGNEKSYLNPIKYGFKIINFILRGKND